MDSLRRDDLERARRMTLEERARLALSTMRMGIHLKRAALRQRFPDASDAEIDERLRRWLLREP